MGLFRILEVVANGQTEPGCWPPASLSVQARLYNSPPLSKWRSATRCWAPGTLSTRSFQFDGSRWGCFSVGAFHVVSRIPSREIVPAGRISPLFFSAHRKSPPSSPVAFVCVFGNGKGWLFVVGRVRFLVKSAFFCWRSACVTRRAVNASDQLGKIGGKGGRSERTRRCALAR